MKITKIITWICLLAMTGGLINGFINGNFFEDGSMLLSNPWGIMSMIDLYVGFTLFAMWINFREENMYKSVIWVVLLMLTGFFIGSIYVLINLYISRGDWELFFFGSKKDKIFSSFSQADNSTTRKFGGTGLGLSICKKIVELMDGNIGVKTEYEKGSTFFFELPYKIGKSTDIKENDKEEKFVKKEKTGKRVLLVDDNEVNREIGYEMLLNEGVESTRVQDGCQALKILEENNFDLIFMDVQMPIMNGFEATKKIKQMDNRKDIPIIAMTANASEEDRRTCLREGMDDYISKPISSEDISKVLKKYLDLK